MKTLNLKTIAMLLLSVAVLPVNAQLNGKNIADIVDSDIDKGILDDKGNVDFGKLKPVIVDERTRQYHVLGPAVGSVYGSSMKFRK